jgi:uridine kinase
LSVERDHLLVQVAAAVPDPALRGVPVRVAVDGIDAAGKTMFAEGLAEALKRLGREVVSVSVDGFHASRERRYTRGVLSAVGYWLDSYDYAAFDEQVLAPFAPKGTRRYRRAAHDVATDTPLDQPWEQAADECVLIVDGIFLLRDELLKSWDFSLFLAVRPKTAIARMALRDGIPPDPADARTRRHIGGQRLYLRSCRPAGRATIVIDNEDFDRPVIRRR